MKNQNFTSAQVAWASQHDWFVSVNNNGNIVARDVSTDCSCNPPRVIVQIVVHTSFADLRDWAGY